MTFRIFSEKKKKLMHNKKIKADATTIKQMIMQACSFKSFCKQNEVFDMNKKRMIKNENNLLRLYMHGIGIDSPFLIINKN